MEIRTDQINLKDFGLSDYRLYIRREDQIHPLISGNKYRKLKYNLQKAKQSGYNRLLTFGGAFSNHLAAVAAAGKAYGFKTVGIVRGDELALKEKLNPTLHFCRKKDMKLVYVTRETYKQKTDFQFLKQLESNFGKFYLLPEGGTNAEAIQGCKEIISEEDAIYDYICVAVGTGGTMAGLVSSAFSNQEIQGFSVLKGTFQNRLIAEYAGNKKYSLTDAYSFGGYGKIETKLVRFINAFKAKTNILLDPVYTGKMM
jgi:1-aminocyclopropane-1-carboxylate deaminase